MTKINTSNSNRYNNDYNLNKKSEKKDKNNKRFNTKTKLFKQENYQSKKRSISKCEKRNPRRR